MKQKIPLSMLNATALAAIVSETMGLDVKPNMGVLGIKAKMAQAGFPTDFIEYDDGTAEGAVPVERVEPPRDRHTPLRRSVELRIEPQEKVGGNDPVFTSVNGVAILIPRGQNAWVDYKYYEALNNAVAHIAITDEDSNIIGYRKVPEYPVSVFHVEPPLTEAERAEIVRQNKAERDRLEAEREAAA